MATIGSAEQLIEVAATAVERAVRAGESLALLNAIMDEVELFGRWLHLLDLELASVRMAMRLHFARQLVNDPDSIVHVAFVPQRGPGRALSAEPRAADPELEQAVRVAQQFSSDAFFAVETTIGQLLGEAGRPCYETALAHLRELTGLVQAHVQEQQKLLNWMRAGRPSAAPLTT